MALFPLFSPRYPINQTALELALLQLSRKTRAELRVVMERKTRFDAQQQVQHFFERLNLSSHEQNSVLIYLSLKPLQIAVYGDHGIAHFMEPDFWQATTAIMKIRCESKEFDGAISDTLEVIGAELCRYYPRETEATHDTPAAPWLVLC